MASNAWKWVLGCGAGCLVVVAILVALSVGGFFVVKDVVEDVVQEVEKTEQTERTLTERYGRIGEYRPEPDGTIPPERVEAFLRVREILAPARDEMAGTLAVLSGEREEGGGRRGGGFAKVRAGMGLIPQLMGYFSARNEALLEGEMGLGEYHYLYAVVFFSWLGESPADGPPFRLVGDEERQGWKGEFGPEDETEVREDRLERTLRSLNRRTLPMLRNQLAALDEIGGADDHDAWRQRLAAEIAAMEADGYRMPWADGVPEAIAASLEPYRTRLEESYSEMCNTVETGVDEH